jgi:hypothetical protein
MNERIKELSKEAWTWAEQQEYTDPAKEFSDILEQKFAELIIKKCVMIGNYAHDGGEYPGPMIKEYFGVE